MPDFVDRSLSALSAMREELASVGGTLAEELAGAPSTESHERLQGRLGELAAACEQTTGAIRTLVSSIEGMREEWLAEHRYTETGLEELKRRLADELERAPVRGARAWLKALLDAADAGERVAAATIAAGPLAWPEALATGGGRLAAAFSRWPAAGAPDAGPIRDLADASLPGWEQVVTPELRSRAHRLAAWIALRNSGDTEAARRHIDRAVDLYPYAGRMHAERAAFHLFAGEFDRAAADAQHAIERAPDDWDGYVELGIWAELTGKFRTADDLYRRGVDLLPTVAVARLHERTALIDPPGRLLGTAAATMLESNRPEKALALAREALLSGVRGREPHPAADVEVIRRRALEQLGEREAAADAAMNAGRLFVWNGEVDRGLDELDRAIELGAGAEACWMRADVLLTKSLPLGSHQPDQELVAEARAAWEFCARDVGLPEGPHSWAYVTRAIIADLESQRPGAKRRERLFEAVLYVEKALVRNHTDAQRWGFQAQFLRYLGLEQLAFECTALGTRLAAADRKVLSEQLPLLTSRRDFDAAEEVAARLRAMYGPDPWVSAMRAWLSLHHHHDYERTLELLQLPLVDGNDPAWYRELQALALLGLGRAGEARDAFQALLEAPPLDGNTKCRLAFASLALRDRAGAAKWLAAAQADPTTPRSAGLMTDGLIRLAAGDFDDAVECLRAAVTEAAGPCEVDDLVSTLWLALRALEATARREHQLRRAIETAAAEHKRRLAEDPPTPDRELERALELERGIAGVALAAIAARREAAHGHTSKAAHRYRRLRDTKFEPEASIALDQLGADPGRFRRASAEATVEPRG